MAVYFVLLMHDFRMCLDFLIAALKNCFHLHLQAQLSAFILMVMDMTSFSFTLVSDFVAYHFLIA